MREYHKPQAIRGESRRSLNESFSAGQLQNSDHVIAYLEEVDIGDLTVEGLLDGQEDGDGEDADEGQAEDDGEAEGELGVGGRRYPQRDRARVQVQHYVPGTGGGLRRAGWGSDPLT